MTVKPHDRPPSSKAASLADDGILMTTERNPMRFLSGGLRALQGLGVLIATGAGTAWPASPPPLAPVVEVEEEVYRSTPANNGAGPMWCSGSTCLVRWGETVYASGLETLAEARPLNNCRWTFWKRGTHGWIQGLADPAGRTREPCPIGLLYGGAVVLSANPTLRPPEHEGGGPARPELLRLHTYNVGLPPHGTMLPKWEGEPRFTEHSYRSLATDPAHHGLILFQNIDYSHAEWAYARVGSLQPPTWPAQGKLTWPWGSNYAKPQPIRICYPNVALQDRAVHFVGVSDIVEPQEAWRQYKRELTGQPWDYDFRRLFYTWCPDVLTQPFAPWIELASREDTCGWISPGDLWIAPDGAVHIVWTERALDERLRTKFFPEAVQRHQLNHALLRDGKVVSRRTLVEAVEKQANEIPHLARFQVTPEHRLFVFFHVTGSDAQGRALSENRILELQPDGSPLPAVKVPLTYPLNSTFTATVRAGSQPSRLLDLLGTRVGAPHTIAYARIRLY